MPFGLDLRTGAADALLTDFADVLVPGLVGFAVLGGGFGELNHDELAVSIVFGIELHHGMGGGG